MLRMQRRKSSRTTGSEKKSLSDRARLAEPLAIASDERHVGNIDFAGTVKIDGQIAGEIHATRVVVAIGATVTGGIEARTIHVDGTVNGPVAGGRISLGPTARITGDVVYDTLSIANGASISGHCQDRATENVAAFHDLHMNGGAVLPFNVAKATCRKPIGHLRLRIAEPDTQVAPTKSMRAVWNSYQGNRSAT
jgi:cytoskeletal protein CcmA (bactofilin family)